MEMCAVTNNPTHKPVDETQAQVRPNTWYPDYIH